jgi:polysaccharide biosynthesis transport protein
MEPTENEKTIQLGEYYHILLKHKWMIILSVIIMLGLVALHNSRLRPIYRATAYLIIDTERTRSPLTGQRTGYESYMSESLTFNTHFKLITSRPVMEIVIRELKLDRMGSKRGEQEIAEANPLAQLFARFKKNIFLLFSRESSPPSPDERITSLVKMLKGMVKIVPMKETRLLRLHVFSPSPQMAKMVANATAQAYIDFNINNRLKASQNTLAWLTDNLYEMNKKLEDAEEEFLAYKQDVKLISVEDSQKIIAQKISEFNESYIRTRNRRLELDAKLAQLRRITGSNENIPNVRSLIANDLINDLYTKLVTAEVELARLGKVFKSKHPKVTQIRTKIENTRSKLREEIKKELNSLKAERAVLLAKENVLQRTVADFEEEGRATARKELKYTILKRNVQMNQRLYDKLLSRTKEADMTGNIDVTNIRITENAILPRRPVSPNKPRNLMLGLIFGLMIGIGLTFLREYMDRTLHTEDDVQKYLGLPVLSVIPLAEKAGDDTYGAAHEHRTQKARNE